MKFVSLHSHSTLCNVDRGLLGRPPSPWCERFYPKILIGFDFDCWPWVPAMKSLSAGNDRYHTTLNFTVGINGFPRQMGAPRWLWVAEVRLIPYGYDVDHKCETFYCLNLGHMQIVPSLVNQGELNKSRGVYDGRKRNALGRYVKEVMPNE